MKKHIPQDVMAVEQKAPQRLSSPHRTITLPAQSPSASDSSERHPVILDELVESIALRNRNAMNPSASQKAHNQRTLSSVLATILSS